MITSNPSFRNRFLFGLQPDDLVSLRQHLEPVNLELRQVLIEANEPIRHVYFHESGYSSVVAGPQGNAAEVGMIGREGVVGLAVVLDSDRMPFDTFIQLAGYGLRIATAAFLDAIAQRPTLKTRLLQHAHVFNVQVGSTAYVNAEHTLEMRLARWLLMCHDRVEGNEFAITHEFLSTMLGVRRAGVTTALHVLEGNKAIRASRGQILIMDRGQLTALADGGYGLAEKEYARLFGSAS